MPPADSRRRAADSSTGALRAGKVVEVQPHPHAALRRSTLPGGLRVVTEYPPAVRSASVGVWVGVGSATRCHRGRRRALPRAPAVQVHAHPHRGGHRAGDGRRRGELNAFTAKEHTCYYAHVLDADLELAVDLVADVVLNGRCAAEDVELERDVVLEEIAMRDDDPEDALGTCSWARCSATTRWAGRSSAPRGRSRR